MSKDRNSTPTSLLPGYGEKSVNATKSQILIVDDSPPNLNILYQALESEGYEILAAPNGENALRIAASTKLDLILLDILMPGIDGFETCRRLKGNPTTADIPIIFITAKDETGDVVRGFQAGGVDYITKPFAADEVKVRVRTHLRISQLTQMLLESNVQLATANRKLYGEIERRQQAEEALSKADEQLSIISDREAARWGISGFIGQSQTIGRILDDVRRLQKAGRTNVLIIGESGTGKELVARAIHFGGPRAEGSFIVVNCSAIPDELAESLFFGHVRGAFTGATTNRKGYFELADSGTLFLDEIGEMPFELQPKLLRVLEDGVVVPVGGSREKQVDVRVLSATNADLQIKIREGGFREDLYYRLAAFTITVPPLCERPDDIPLLVDHFLNLFAADMRIKKPSLRPETLAALRAYRFPGNIRELKNVVEHALIKSGGAPIKPAHLNLTHQTPASRRQADSVDPQQAETLLIKGALAQTNGDVNAAARLLSLPPARVQPFASEIQPPPAPIDVPVRPPSEEDLILAYVRQNHSITNAECRALLGVDRRRAVYLLDRMTQAGLLTREGSHRGARYALA